MTLPSSGTLTISQINSEFGRGLNLGSYRGTTWYTDAGSSGTFTSTNLGFDQFYGKRVDAPYRFGTGSGSFNNYGTYGYSFLYVTNGQPYAGFRIYLYSTTSGQPTGLVVSGTLDSAGNYAGSFYTPNTDPYWYPAPQTNNFYLEQQDQAGVYRFCNFFSSSS